jgi:hypothetical protein
MFYVEGRRGPPARSRKVPPVPRGCAHNLTGALGRMDTSLVAMFESPATLGEVVEVDRSIPVRKERCRYGDVDISTCRLLMDLYRDADASEPMARVGEVVEMHVCVVDWTIILAFYSGGEWMFASVFGNLKNHLREPQWSRVRKGMKAFADARR